MSNNRAEFPEPFHVDPKFRYNVWAEIDVNIVLFLVLGFALRDVLQSFISDLLIPLTANSLGMKPVKDKMWVPYPGAAPVRYGQFIEALFGFVVVCTVLYFLLKIS